MKKILFIIIISNLLLTSCDTVRDSAGVNRKVIDEYAVIENPPLVIPPNFNLLPPEQMGAKKIEDTDSELAKEILFGLENDDNQQNDNFSLIEEIVNETKANDIENNIRNQVNQVFAGEKSTIDDEIVFNNKDEVDNAIIKTEQKGSISDNNIDKKEKKKKRFFFF